MANLVKFVRKFWLQDKQADPQRQNNLSISNLVDFLYNPVPLETTRQGTIEIFTKEGGKEKLEVTDDAKGFLVGKSTGILEDSTGAVNTVDYTNNKITITWDPVFLAKLTQIPFIRWKIILATEENHAEMKDLITEVLAEYKEKELENQLKYYDPENIPLNQIHNLVLDNNWILDKTLS